MSQTQPTTLTRSRAHSWDDPSATAAALGRMSGVETLRAVMDGRLPPPPIMSTLGLEAVRFDVGVAVFAFDPAEFQYNPLGTVHGGAIATALDSAAGCAVHSVLDESTGYTSLDLSVKYLRRVTVDTGRVTAEGRVLSRGRSTALAEARLTDADGRLLAHATSTCAVFPIPTETRSP